MFAGKLEQEATYHKYTDTKVSPVGHNLMITLIVSITTDLIF